MEIHGRSLQETTSSKSILGKSHRIPMLNVSNLSVQYGQVVALRNFSFNVEQGDAIAILGTNGAGKTSCVEAISGLIPTAGGRVRFLGQDITGASASSIARSGIALVPQLR